MTLFVCVFVRACDCFFNPLMEMRTKYLAKIICYTHIYFIKVDDYREELISRTNSGHLLTVYNKMGITNIPILLQ